jgi:outer membrane protein assembly factor BamB
MAMGNERQVLVASVASLMEFWVLGFCLLTAASAQTPPNVDAPWAMMRRDSRGTGATDAALLPPCRELVRLTSPHRFTPAVAANDVIYFGSADHNVYAYHLPQLPPPMLTAADPLTPQDDQAVMQSWGKLWQFATGADVEAAPAIADGVLYVASTDHFLYALDAAGGKLRWRVRFGDDARAAPVVEQGAVYVGADDRVFRAMDAADGRILWATELPGEIRAPAAVGENAVYVACADHFVYALHRGTGQQIWSADVGDDVTSPLTLADGKIFGVNLLGKLFALEQDTGKLLWSHSYPIMAETAPAFADGRIFLTRDDGNVVALDAATGQKLWTTARRARASLGSLFGPNGTPAVETPTVPRVRSAGSPVVGGRYVYVNAGNPEAVFVMEAATGNVVDGLPTDSPFVSRSAGTPVLAQEDDSPPRSARARRVGQVHLSLYGDFLIAAMPQALSVIRWSPKLFPLETPGVDVTGSWRSPLLPSRIAGGRHIEAILDLYGGTPQPLAVRKLLPPNKYILTTDHALVTLDSRRSRDWGGHAFVKWVWIEDLGGGAILSRIFGVGAHRVFLVVTDEEGAASSKAQFTFVVRPFPASGAGNQTPRR